MERPWLTSYEDNVPHDIDVPETTMFHIFHAAVTSNPDGVAISYFGKKMTYRELGQLVDQFARALLRLQVKPGDRVAIMLPNIPQYVVFHFALMRIGATIVPTNPLYVEREIKYQLNNSGAKAIITLDRLLPIIQNIKAETGLKHIIVTRAQQHLPWFLKLLAPLKRRSAPVKVGRAPGVHLYEDLLTEEFQNDLPEVAVQAGDVAIFLYTGGTTGVSKGAVLTHRNLVANVLQTRAWYTTISEKQEVLLSALPFFHSYGMTACLHQAVNLKSTMVLIPDPRNLKVLLSALQKERATLFPGVPTLFVAINNFPGVEKYDLSSLKGCMSGGAALPMQVARQFEKVAAGKLAEGYGLSETSPVTHANPFLGVRKEGSIGIPVPSTRARIVDLETREPLAVGEVGELAVHGPQVMQRYWKMEEETRQVLQDGWLYTGDMARMDEDGYFYIVDRKKDMIIAGGFNIYPREIEEVLFEHPKILEAAVIGVPDEYRGETVKAFVVCKPGQSMTSDELIGFCKQKLAAFKIPKRVEFRESLPKSNIGKVLRRVLKEQEDTKTRKSAKSE